MAEYEAGLVEKARARYIMELSRHAAADDPLWNVVGAGKRTGEPVARHHDAYLYRKDD